MREFYEQWCAVFSNRPLSMGDLALTQNSDARPEDNTLALTISTTTDADIDLNLLSKHFNGFDVSGLSYDEFIRVGFTHHSEILAKEKSLGEFKPAHLGQLNFYLSALDEYVRQADEAPSIGIILCKEANRSIVEFAVRDYTKPMGVATYRTRNEMPETWQKALPDFEDMKKLLDATP
jgi:hypothetical protein